MPAIRDLDVLELWRRPPGTLDRWIRWVTACACAITIALVAVGPRVLWEQTWAEGNQAAHRGIDPFWFRNGLAMIAGCWAMASFIPRWRLSRFVRVAVLLPILHLVLIAIAWWTWTELAPRVPKLLQWSELVDALPIGAMVAVQTLAVVVLAWLIARGRRDWSHAFVMLALVELLLVGLWVPITCWMRCRGPTPQWAIDPSFVLDHPIGLVATALVPPVVAAAAYTALEIRRPELAQRMRSWALGAVIALFGVAVVVRCDASPAACVVYANLIEAMLATALVAIAGIGILGVATWWRARSSRRELARASAIEGVIAADDPDEPVVACVEIASWLCGPRSLVRPFVVETAAGELPIHGARLVAPIAPSTTQIRVGESVAVLRAGDRVAITGLDRADPGDPFRTMATPIAGPGVIVAPRDLGSFGVANVALAIWRPSIAYLVILVAVAGPALAALALNSPAGA